MHHILGYGKNTSSKESKDHTRGIFWGPGNEMLLFLSKVLFLSHVYNGKTILSFYM